jgi:hypothetical protein
MLSDIDKQRLQAGFDGELDAREWRRLRESFRDCAEADAYLAELAALQGVLSAAPEVPVPGDLAANIKQLITVPAGDDKVSRVDFGARRRAQPRPAVNLAGGLALAASLLLAVLVGVQFSGVSELGTDSPLRSRMTGTLLDSSAQDAQQHWQWPGGEARAALLSGANGLTLALDLATEFPVELVLGVSGDQWRWRQEATSAPFSDGQRAAPGQLRLAVDATRAPQRYRFALEPLSRDGKAAQGAASRVDVRVEQGGRLLQEATLTVE